MKLSLKVTCWTVSCNNVFPIIETFGVLFVGSDFALNFSQNTDRGNLLRARGFASESDLVADVSGSLPNILSEMTASKLGIWSTVVSP